MSIAAPLLALAPGLVTAELTAAGRWTVIDDEDHQPVAVMKIFEQNGEYLGLIEDIVSRPGEDPNPICSNCPGPLKDSPIRGLTIMHGLKRQGGRYTGGRILDPDSGSYYRVKMSLAPDGNTLKVRGYLGVSLLGRTQTWYRAQ